MNFIGPLVHASLIKRPSKTCKTPYVADVCIDSTEEVTMAHTPSLGCCGLIDNGTQCKMLMKKLEGVKKTCSHRVEFVELPNKTLLCVNPKMSEDLVELVFANNKFSGIGLNKCKSVSREVSFTMADGENSRFDFAGVTKDNKEFILEVKSVPLTNKDSISYFPDGYRKKKGDVVSPRALKHIQHLEEMVGKGYQSILAFCVQRGDSKGFKLSDDDVTYKNAVLKAQENGVKVVVLYFNWELVESYAHCDLERVEGL